MSLSTKLLALILLPAVLAAAGCKYAFSDVATRIRYALLAAQGDVRSSPSGMVTLSLQPDHWPDNCRKGAGYRLVLSPYKGDKQVAVGDIVVHCHGGGQYYTGLGSERIYVSRELSVEKQPGEELHLVLRRTSAGVEIVELK